MGTTLHPVPQRKSLYQSDNWVIIDETKSTMSGSSAAKDTLPVDGASAEQVDRKTNVSEQLVREVNAKEAGKAMERARMEKTASVDTSKEAVEQVKRKMDAEEQLVRAVNVKAADQAAD